ncbi:tripartite tricarboxylate transporter permease [Bacillus dakarensis]|uniref:tripartite tricarboxylate transporter permease n=1 Tax=Robertmurraya dakarensis TaxID=1926278 RepID=UPI000980929C|nr:tripartite tricarboxylate transporter permease [Bacillus dakarensis]
MFSQIFDGFVTMFTPLTILLTTAGVIAGTLLGAIPGLTATMGIALILPVTFYLDPIAGIVMLTAMYKGGLFGGSVSAIMFNAPGTPAAAATAMDGYSLKRKGYPRKAIRTALVASTIGDMMANLVLIFSAAAIASLALKFGPAEYTSLVLFALILIITVSGGSMAKGIISVIIGLMIATIGADPETAIPRLNFGFLELSGGISIIALVIGLLAVSEVFTTIEQYFTSRHNKSNSTDLEDDSSGSDVPKGNDNITLKEISGMKRTLFRSSAIGTAIGALPGLGPVTASFVSYTQARKKAKNPENFGKGEQEGIAAAEGANSAVASANLIPLLSLGIPGDAEAALIFGALIMHGIIPGPQILEHNGSIVYGIMAGMLMASIICFILNWYGSTIYRKISFIRPTVLAPIILVLCVAGTYGYSQAAFDIVLVFVFGIMGYLLNKVKIPLVGIIIGFVLGPKLEESVRQVLSLSGGNITMLFTKPISLLFLAISFFLIINAIRKSLKSDNKNDLDLPVS